MKAKTDSACFTVFSLYVKKQHINLKKRASILKEYQFKKENTNSKREQQFLERQHQFYKREHEFKKKT